MNEVDRLADAVLEMRVLQRDDQRHHPLATLQGDTDLPGIDATMLGHSERSAALKELLQLAIHGRATANVWQEVAKGDLAPRRVVHDVKGRIRMPPERETASLAIGGSIAPGAEDAPFRVAGERPLHDQRRRFAAATPVAAFCVHLAPAGRAAVPIRAATPARIHHRPSARYARSKRPVQWRYDPTPGSPPLGARPGGNASRDVN